MIEQFKNTYPGRGIILGLTPSGNEFVQIYFITGRSQGSKNRIIVKENCIVKTEPYDKSIEMENIELKIYTAAMQTDNAHIITNGRQTDTVHEYLTAGRSFEDSLYQWKFEDDPPIYTPRISGVTFNDGSYKLSIIKAVDRNPDLVAHQLFSYSASLPGCGHCVHTYSVEQECMPYSGEPFSVKIFETLEENAEYYWNILPDDKKVALYVKHIAKDKTTDKILSIYK